MFITARTQQKQWEIAPPDDSSAQLAKAINTSPLLAQVLINRQITDAETAKIFLRPKLTELIVPEKMPGVENAVERIKHAIKNHEKITVYGDYDVDGITGVSILWQILKLLDADVDYYIPHRIDEGYGLNTDAVQELANTGTKLLLTADCGINAFESAELANQLNLDLIITDHHQPKNELPAALTIVHPAINQDYPNQDSAGAMVAFKLAWALANEFNTGPKLNTQMRQFMLNATSMAAMGTVADVVDLRGENRILTHYGLKSLPHCSLCGIGALIESAGLTGKGLESFDIGFRLGPMLNAAGRMGHARLAVELLTSNNQIRATQIAEYLKEQNVQRQQRQRKIFKLACEQVVQNGLGHPDHKTIVVTGKDWHAGVVGIVASKLVDKYYRPAIVINSENSTARGSARSIEGFDLLQAINACSKHLTRFGGHKMAAGITIETDKIPAFAADFEAYAKTHLSEQNSVAKLHIDAETQLSRLNMDTVAQLQSLAPFGKGNPEPIFATFGLRLAAPPRRVGVRADHLQLAITDTTATIRCIGFGLGKLEKKLLEADFFNAAYTPQLNTYNGNTNIQLSLTDIKFE